MRLLTLATVSSSLFQKLQSQQLTAKKERTHRWYESNRCIRSLQQWSCLLALLGDALLVGDEGCETAIGERVLE